jgi:uncharacterized protein involved in type VI secretion and phage assembly
MNGSSATGRFIGKFRAIVADNNDPEQRGRLKLKIPDVLGTDVLSTWAEACTPLAGPGGKAMGVYMVPPVNAGVWVEFEQGDPDYPVWVGCRWGARDEVPKQAHEGPADAPNIVIQSSGQNRFIITDQAGDKGGLILQSASGSASIIVNDTGIYIDNGQGATIELKGPKVSLNGTALEVT